MKTTEAIAVLVHPHARVVKVVNGLCVSLIWSKNRKVSLFGDRITKVDTKVPVYSLYLGEQCVACWVTDDIEIVGEISDCGN